jgi:hypothetical protein
MSFKMINWAYTHELPAATMLTLVTLADMASDQGRTEVSREYLMWKTGQSQRTIARHYAELRSRDLLHQEERRRKDGLRGVSETILHWHVAGPKGEWPGREEWLREAQERRRKYEIVDETAPQHSNANMAHDDEPPSQNYVPTWHLTSETGGKALQSHRSNATDGQCQMPALAPDGKSALKGTRARFNPSSSSAPALEPDDDDDINRFYRGVDLQDLAKAMSGRFKPQPWSIWTAVVDVVLDRAKGRVSSPTRFVTAALQFDPWGVIAEAHHRLGLDGHVNPGSVAPDTAEGDLPSKAIPLPVQGSQRTTSLGPGDQPCPVEGHGSYWVENCPACSLTGRVAEPESAEASDPEAGEQLLRRIRERRTSPARPEDRKGSR